MDKWFVAIIASAISCGFISGEIYDTLSYEQEVINLSIKSTYY